MHQNAAVIFSRMLLLLLLNQITASGAMKYSRGCATPVLEA